MITTLARELQLKVTAEGVETEKQAEFLGKVGCDTLQGYLFSKPMSEDLLPGYFLKSVKKKSAKKNKTTHSKRSTKGVA